MSGLLGAIAGGAQAGSMLGIRKDGLDPFVFSDKPVEGAITTADMIDQPQGSSARWMFEEAARQNGLDPDAVVKGSPEHRQITQDLDAALVALKDAPMPKGEAARTEALRGAIRDAVTADGPRLSVAQAATLATMPGAQAMSAPSAQAALRAAATIARHPAAQAGLAAGVAGTIAAGELLGPTTERTRVGAGAVSALDTDRDGRVECPEIGKWLPDVGEDSRLPNARAYQTHVTGVPGMDFKVTTPITGAVRFDGCRDLPDGALLLEAKADHGVLLTEGAERWSVARDAVGKQGDRQQNVSQSIGVHAEWHVQTAIDQQAIKDVFVDKRVLIPVIHDPMPRAE